MIALAELTPRGTLSALMSVRPCQDGKVTQDPDRAGRSPLHYAALEGDAASIRRLIAEGADPNSVDRAGWSPLHFAAQSQSAEAAQTLLNAGAAVDPRDSYGKTPLAVALFNVRDGEGAVVRVLLAAGADPDAENDSGVSPRGLAELVSNYNLMRFFD